MSSKNEDKKILMEYIINIINLISNTDKNNDITSDIDSFKENIIIWINEEDKNDNKKLIEIFSIIKYLISRNNQKEKEIIKNNIKEKSLNTEEKENIIKSIEAEKEPKENKNKIIIIHKNPFNIFPIIFSSCPNLTQKYFNIFLTIIHQCICEENKVNFPFLSKIFSECIISFFDNNNINRASSEVINNNNNNLLSNKDSEELYSKLLYFSLNLINTNEKLEQSFGCLLLSEIIEKCPLIKVKKIYNEFWKIISKYLEDKWFLCKLDLLNCIISFIFILENKFEPYANECLFRILDYLTDKDWMKRKLSINIIYTLIFYCKKEIANVKHNIIEFLEIVKNDNVSEVRDICLKTLELIEDEEQKKIKEEKDRKEKEEKERKEKEEMERKEREEKEKKEKEEKEKEKLMKNDKRRNKKIYQKKKEEKKEKNKNYNNKKYIFSGEKKLFEEKIKYNNNIKSNSIFKNKKEINKSSINNSRTTKFISNEISKKEVNYSNKSKNNVHKNNLKLSYINGQNNTQNIIHNLSFMNSEKSIELQSEGNSNQISGNNAIKDFNFKENDNIVNPIKIKNDENDKNEQKGIKNNNFDINEKININNINNSINLLSYQGKDTCLRQNNIKEEEIKNYEKEDKIIKKEKENIYNKNNDFYNSFLTKNLNINNLIDKNNYSFNKRNNEELKTNNKKTNSKKILLEECFIEKICKETEQSINEDKKKDSISFLEMFKKIEENQNLILKTIEENKNMILEKVDKLENKIKENYNSLDKRLKSLESIIKLNEQKEAKRNNKKKE